MHKKHGWLNWAANFSELFYWEQTIHVFQPTEDYFWSILSWTFFHFDAGTQISLQGVAVWLGKATDYSQTLETNQEHFSLVLQNIFPKYI